VFININYFKIFCVFIITGILLFLTGSNAVSANPSNSHFFHSGPIASINKDWIVAGQWMGFINKTNPTDAGFYSIFNMVMKNGSSPHIHKIYNAIAHNITQRGNETIVDGTVSITMKNGPIDNVPTKIIIGNNNTIAISLDPSKTTDHFGNTPIYGLVHNSKQGFTLIKMIISDPEIIKKWIPMMTGSWMHDMKNMMNIKNWKMNHSMMKFPVINTNTSNNYLK
jgi:hypothetical protein